MDKNPPGEHFSAREIAVQEFNSLRGRLCTAIESAGLPAKQERALVLMVKNLSYQNQAVIAELIDKVDHGDGQGNPILFRYNSEKLNVPD
jgi:hypothetical protein